MSEKDPFAMNWLEVRILTRLADRGHAVTLHDMKDNLVDGKSETVVNTVFQLQDEGLLRVFETEKGGQLVEITEEGKTILSLLYSSGGVRG